MDMEGGIAKQEERMADDISSFDFKAPLPVDSFRSTSEEQPSTEANDHQKNGIALDAPNASEKSSSDHADNPARSPAFSYKEPSWATPASGDFSFEVVKNGTVVNNISLTGKSFFAVGRLPGQCDICVEHPSCSRFHAVIQFGKNPENNLLSQDGCYIYDLHSTHGTTVNKVKIAPET